MRWILLKPAPCLLAAALAFAQQPGTSTSVRKTFLTAKQVGQRLDAYVKPLADANEISGALLVSRGGVPLYQKAWGMANYELDVPNTPQTKFCVASLSKPLTVILSYHLIAEGKLSQEDKLSKWIPDYPRGGEITVAQLLSHESGIPHRVIPDEEQTRPLSAADMVRYAAKAGFSFEPGSQNGYSSAGYSVLARVLELAGGKPFNQLMDEVVFLPAGALDSVAVADRITLLKNRALSYQPVKPRIHAPLRDLSFLVGAGSAYSTAQDLHRIIQRLLQSKYLGGPEKRLVREGGFGWNGITNGYRAFADYSRDTDVSVIFTSNMFTGAADLLRRDIPKIVRGDSVPAPTVPQPKFSDMPVEERGALEGQYRLGPTSQTTGKFSEDGRFFRFRDRLLMPIGPDVFYSGYDYQEVKVERATDGTVKALVWGPPGKGPRFERIAAAE